MVKRHDFLLLAVSESNYFWFVWLVVVEVVSGVDCGIVI
jgi:hypothetical protein